MAEPLNYATAGASRGGSNLPVIGGYLAIAGTFIGTAIFVAGCFGFAVPQEIQHERHGRHFSDRAARCPHWLPARGRRAVRSRSQSPAGAGGAVLESMSNVIMKPLVPLYSNAFGPSR